MDSAQQTRREFCTRTCSTAALAALGGTFATLLQGCGGGSGPTSASGVNFAALPTVQGTISGNSVLVTIDSASPLASAGSLALVRAGSGGVLVARTGPDAFSALSATCTHAACGITGYSGQIFVCPCHGSEFDSSGRVVAGPARTALSQYATQFAGNVLTISL